MAVSVATAACAGPRNGGERLSSPGTSAAQAEGRCDLGIPRAWITVSDDGDGLLLTYTTQIADVSALRRIVRDFAASQNRAGAEVPGSEIGQSAIITGVPESPPGTTLVLPSIRASVADVPGGSTLELRPLGATFRRLLRADVREDRLPAGARCPSASGITPAPTSASP